MNIKKKYTGNLLKFLSYGIFSRLAKGRKEIVYESSKEKINYMKSLIGREKALERG